VSDGVTLGINSPGGGTDEKMVAAINEEDIDPVPKKFTD